MRFPGRLLLFFGKDTFAVRERPLSRRRPGGAPSGDPPNEAGRAVTLATGQELIRALDLSFTGLPSSTVTTHKSLFLFDRHRDPQTTGSAPTRAQRSMATRYRASAAAARLR
jgi:hypothetical protein